MSFKKIFVIIAVFFLSVITPAALNSSPFSVGAVYVMTNDAEGNEIAVFNRSFNGKLSPAEFYPTEGLGSGGGVDPLGSQGSLVLSRNKQWLVAVNAGSNTISVFRVRHNNLVLTSVSDSGGIFPVSLALRHKLLYVLNAGQGGDSPNITGFRLSRHGNLRPLHGSTRVLGDGAFRQVGFNPRGNALVITQGDPAGTNAILVYLLRKFKLPAENPVISDSSGIVPFGFIFDWRGHLLVSEAGSGAVSSYAIRKNGTLKLIDASVPNGNSATCWIAGTWFGAVFTANTGSDNISSYKVNPFTGKLRLVDPEAAFGDKPIDMTITGSGRFLYVLNAGDGTVDAFRIHWRGNLKRLGTVAGLPFPYAQGIAVR